MYVLLLDIIRSHPFWGRHIFNRSCSILTEVTNPTRYGDERCCISSFIPPGVGNILKNIQYARDENSALGILSKRKLIEQIPDPEIIEFQKELEATFLKTKEDTSPASAGEKTDGDNGETNNSQDKPSVQ